MPSLAWFEQQAADLDALRRRVDQLEDRPRVSGRPADTRLAVTVRDPYDDSYPDPATDPNTYWVVIVTGSYPDLVGNQPETLLPRQNPTAAQHKAHNIINGVFVPVYSLLIVHWIDGQWWFQKCSEDSTEVISSGVFSSGASP